VTKTPASAQPRDLTGQTIVVTGASPGSLGFETARILATWGAKVAVSTRSTSRDAVAALTAAVPTGAGSIIGHNLDLADATSVATFGEWLLATTDRLDVLVNNAGVHLDLRSKWTTPTLTPDGVEVHWRTNYLGTAQLTHHVLPRLRETAATSGEARVVNVVSKLHSRATNENLFAPITPYNSWTAYGASKLAMIHLATELDRRHSNEGLHGYSLHPGSVYTKIADKGLASSPVIARVRKAFAPVESRMLLSPTAGAQTSVHCTTAPNLSPGYYRDCQPAEPSPAATDAEAAAWLWTETEAWIAAR